MVDGTKVLRRRLTAAAAVAALVVTYQWAGGATFGPQAAPPAPNIPSPAGSEPLGPDDEFADRILRDDEFLRDRAYPNDTIPLDALVEAQAQAAQLPVIDTVRSLPTTDSVIADAPLTPSQLDQLGPPLTTVAWTQVGDRGISSYTEPGLDFYNGTPNLSGRFIAMATHPTNTNVVYAGAASGGVHKTTDGGATWTSIFDGTYTPGNLPLPQSIGAIAIDPDSPNTVYVGSGEGSGGFYYGQGLFKSTDGGATWTKLDPPGAANLDYCHISDIVVPPGTGDVVVAVAQRAAPVPVGGCTTDGTTNTAGGLWHLDGGGTWTHTQTIGTTDLALDPNNPQRIYAGDYQYGTLYSSSGGMTWVVPTAPVPALGRVEVTAADLGATTRVYAALESSSFLSNIYVSTDDGVTYTPVDGTPPSGVCNYPGTGVAQCGYDFDLEVSPSNPNELYLAGILLARSTDAGLNWTTIGNDAAGGDRQLHVDIQKLAFDSSNRLWIGSDGGIQRTPTGASFANTFTNLTGSLNVQQFQHGISVTSGGTLYGGTQDLGSSRYTGGPGWQMWLSGDGGPTAVDPRDEDVVFGTYVYGQTYRSTDGGQNNTQLSSANCYGEGTSFCRFYAPLEMDPARPDRIYVGTDWIRRTTDQWATFPQQISPSFAGRISAIAPAPSDADVIYAGTDAGALHVATDGGTTNAASWPLRTAGLPTRTITDILVDPFNALHAWVTVSGFDSGHVFETFNGGSLWSDVSGDLPNTPVNAIDADFRLATPTLVVATDVGILASDDGGTSWARLGTGLPPVPSLDVVVNSAANEVIAGTTGRGMWRAPAGCPVPGGDAFASPRVLSGPSATDTVDNSCAYVEFGEPMHNSGPFGSPPVASMWWTWTAPADGQVMVDTSASAVVDTVLAAYTGTTLGGLNQIASNDDNGVDLHSEITFPVTGGTTYRIVADGYNGSHRGSITVALNAALMPSAPGNVQVTPGDGRLEVSWDAASGNGSPITGYDVTVSPGGASCATPSTSCTVTGLTNGTTYTVSVTATNANGTSPPATGTGTPVKPLPFPPTNLRVTPKSEQLVVAWDAADPNGSPITGYDVTVSPGGASCATSSTSCTVTGLTNGTTYTVSVTATNANGTSAAATATGTPSADVIVGLQPGRVYESRPGLDTVDDQQAGGGRIGAGEVVEVQVAGRAGVPSDAAAGVVNITAIRPDAAGFITSFPCGTTQPGTASLNYTAGQIIANGAIIKLGTGGTVCIFTSHATDLVVDVTGYVPNTSAFGTGEPARLYESRPGQATIDGQQAGDGRTSAGEVVEVQVGGRGGVPSDAAAAVLNATAIRPDAGGFITSFPCGAPQPLTASLNFAAGDVIANGAAIKLGTGGKVCIFTSQPMDLVVDVTGYVPAGTEFSATEPGRVFETRPGQETVDDRQAGVGRTTDGQVVEVEIAGRAGVPSDAIAAVLNITAIRPDAAGFITSFPCGSPQPLTASLNFAAGQIIGNGAIIRLGQGKVCIFTSHAMDLVVDVTGFVGAR